MRTKSDLLRDLTIPRDEQPAPRRVGARTLIGGGVLAVIGAAALLGVARARPAAGDDSTHTAAAPDARRIGRDSASEARPAAGRAAPAAAVVAAGDSKLDASGFITARRVATVSAKTFGLIKAVLIDEGDHVSAGQIIARLDDAQAQLALQLAEAQRELAAARVQGAEVELGEAQRVLAREKTLQSKNFTSAATISNFETQVNARAAALASARADFDVAGVQVAQQRRAVEDHVIRAPFDGIVTVKNAQPGEIIAPTSAGGGYTRTGICTIVDMASLEIVVDVNEEFISRVHAGQAAQAELYAYKGWTFPARVIRVIPSADRGKATVRVRLGIVNSDVRILPDMAVKVSFL